MAEKKPAAKKPAAKRTAKPKQAVPDVVDGIITTPGERAGVKPSTWREFTPATPKMDQNEPLNPKVDYSDEVLNQRPRAQVLAYRKARLAPITRANRKAAKLPAPDRTLSPAMQAAQAAADKKRRANAKKNAVAPDMAKRIAAVKAEEEAARVADRVRKGASPKGVGAPKAGTTRRGNPRAAGDVVETKVKRTSSARAVQRRAISAKEQAKLDSKAMTANDYLGPKPKKEKDLGSAVASRKDLMTGYSSTKHGKAMKQLEALDALLGPGGSNLGPNVSPETKQAVSARMTSARTSHDRSYHAAVNGDPVFALRHMHDANETLQSIGKILRADPEVMKSRSISVAKGVDPIIKKHTSVVSKTLTAQKKNMSIETTDPEWKTADSVLGLRNEGTTAKSGPYAGLRPAKDFRTPDARNPKRGHALLPTIHSLIAGAMSYTRAPSVVEAAQNAGRAAMFFGDSVEMGDTAAVQKHGNALLGHIQALHKATKEVVGARPNFSPQMRDTVTANLDRHLGHAEFRIAEILGEK